MKNRVLQVVSLVILCCALGACAEKKQPHPSMAMGDPGACYSAIQGAKPLSSCDEDCKRRILEICVGDTENAYAENDQLQADDDSFISSDATGAAKPKFDVSQVPLGLDSSGSSGSFGSFGASDETEAFLEFFGEVLKLAIENAHHYIH